MGVPLPLEEKVLKKRIVSLRGRKQPSAPALLKPKNFRLPEHIDGYLKAASLELGRSETDIVLFAIELDRDLSQGLADDQERLLFAATQLGLDYERDLPRLLTILVRKGLDKIEAESREAVADGGKRSTRK